MPRNCKAQNDTLWNGQWSWTQRHPLQPERISYSCCHFLLSTFAKDPVNKHYILVFCGKFARCFNPNNGIEVKWLYPPEALVWALVQRQWFRAQGSKCRTSLSTVAPWELHAEDPRETPLYCAGLWIGDRRGLDRVDLRDKIRVLLD